MIRSPGHYSLSTIAISLSMLSCSEVMAQADAPGTVRDSSVIQGNVPPFNKSIAPQGTYTHGNSAAKEIRVELGIVNAQNVWAVLPNEPVRIASTSQTPGGILTWSAATYQNLANGKYAIRVTLWDGFGTEPVLSPTSVTYGAHLTVK